MTNIQKCGLTMLDSNCNIGRIAELEKLVKDWQGIAQYAGRIIEEYKHLMPIEAAGDIERSLYDIAKAPKEES